MERISSPKVRFSEFAGNWDERKLGDVLTIRYGKDQKAITTLDGMNPVLGTGGEIGKTNSFLYDKPSVLIGRKGTIDKPKYIDIPFWTVDTLFYTEISDSVVPKFVYYQLCRINWYLYNEASGVPSLSASTVSKVKALFPKYIEQQKIADFLTAVDAKIEQLTRKKALLERYKKGVSQQIFSQQLRFKDDEGNDFPEWEWKSLNKVFRRSISKNIDNAVNTVLTNSAILGIVHQSDYFDHDVANQNNLKGYYLVDVDDFVYNPRISQSAPVGPLKRNHLTKGVMSPLYTVLKCQQGNLNFFEQYFLTSNWHEFMKGIANYGARHDRMNIKNQDFENLPIPFPDEVEQSKISNFLLVIDAKIDSLNRQLQQAQTFKKGLLQQMFI